MTAPWRTQKGRRPDPPPPSGLADQLDTTARQVRLDGRDDNPVHRLWQRRSDPDTGVHYRTICDLVLSKAGGAILTTQETTCGRCRGGGRRG